MRPAALAPLLLGALLCGACTNNPYPDEDAHAKVLYESFAVPPKTLDPAVAYSVYDHLVTGNVFDTLLEYHYLDRPYRLIPGLATDVPVRRERSDGRVAYRFTLRPGVLFQDDDCFALGGAGRRTREVTAADVAFSLARIADPAVSSPVVDTFGKLHGLRDFSARLTALRTDPAMAALRPDEQYALAGGIVGVRVLGAHELEIVLDEPYPPILYWFAMPFTAPLPWEAVATYDGREGRDNLADHPVGTGPFRLRHYDRLSRIVLERNPNWYGALHPEWRAPGTVYPSTAAPALAADGLLAAAGRPLPFVDRIELRRDPESVPAFFKFMQGYYDTSPIIRESFDQVVQRGTLSPSAAAQGLRLRKTVDAGVYYLGFNMEDAVVGGAARGRALRQAMSLMIDAETFLRLFTNDRGLAAQSPLPPDIFGYDPSYRNPFRSVDPERAAALMVEAGYPRGVDPATGRPLRLTLDTPDTRARSMLMYTFFIEAWRRLGLDVELAATDYNRFQDKVRQGAYQIFWWGWSADYPDPENFLFLLYGPNGQTHSGGTNAANFADPRYDELFVRMRGLDNGPERLAVIADMRALLERARPWIELFHPEDYALFQPWMAPAAPPALSLPIEKYLEVDPPVRARLRREWNVPIRWPAALVLVAAVVFVAPALRRARREARR